MTDRLHTRLRESGGDSEVPATPSGSSSFLGQCSSFGRALPPSPSLPRKCRHRTRLSSASLKEVRRGRGKALSLGVRRQLPPTPSSSSSLFISRRPRLLALKLGCGSTPPSKNTTPPQLPPPLPHRLGGLSTGREREMTQLPSVCPDCGVVFTREGTAARCFDCEQPRKQESQASSDYLHKGSPESRGYDWRWRQLSKRARSLSPQCEDCGSVDDLTADHSVQAWERVGAGKSIRLQDISVVCRRCNAERGAARGPGASAHLQWERDLSVLAQELEGEDNDGHGQA